jgi:UTP--glucose-1-phosphate uridylyltransferase
MLTVVDKPIIQYAVEEAKAAGIDQFIFITSRGKSVLEDHFDPDPDFYASLQKRGKTAELAAARSADLPTGHFTFIRQPEPLGLGHAVWCARALIGDEPFAVLLPDEIFLCRTPLLKQMALAHEETGGNLLAVREVPREMTNRYGILGVGADDGRLAEVTGLVEKPRPEVAPSTLSIVGRYILDSEVFTHLERQDRGAGGEIQLTDAMARLIGHQPFHGLRFEGRRFDCGDKAGFVAANLAYALAREDLADRVRRMMSDFIGEAVDA